MSSYENDLRKSTNALLKQLKKSVDVNNLLLMYQSHLISESDLKSNKDYKEYYDSIKGKSTIK